MIPVILVSLLAHCGLGAAAEAAPPVQYAIEQPSQPVAVALQAIAHETSTSVLFDPKVVRGRVAHPVSGRLSAFEAITAALQGTGLVAVLMNDGAIVVRLAAAPAAGSAGETGALLAAVGGAEAGSPTPGGHSDDTQVVKVEVTGSRLRRVEVEGPAPVNVYSAKDIEKSGQPNLERFLAGLNEVSTSSAQGALSPTLGQGTVQLRGLPLGTTLVLINGRRVESVGSSSANFFNLNHHSDGGHRARRDRAGRLFRRVRRRCPGRCRQRHPEEVARRRLLGGQPGIRRRLRRRRTVGGQRVDWAHACRNRKFR